MTVRSTTAELLVVHEHRVPGGNSLVTGVSYRHGSPPAVCLGIFRGDETVSTLLIHADGFDALERILDAHRRGEHLVEEVHERQATMRIVANTKVGAIVFSRFGLDGSTRGRARTVLPDEVAALEEALRVAREEGST